MSQPNDLKALIESIPGRTVAARLRRIMPEIDRRIREGVQHDEIIETLNAHGFDLNLNTFRSNLYRYRKKVRVEQSASPAPELASAATPLPTQNSAPEPDIPVTSPPSLDDVLDARKRDEFGESYLVRRRPLLGNKRGNGS